MTMNVIGIKPNGYTDWDAERPFFEDPQKNERRATFEIDKGRIIHSAAFRRLQGKTQVLGVGERDFYRTRLTHSLEVAQLGRGICTEADNDTGFKPDPDLVETICLAHDIGHPAFGHVGEKKLHMEMLSHGGFGANPQNLRIVMFLEQKHRGGEFLGKPWDGGGLNLTRATLDGLIKYPALFALPACEESSKFTYASYENLRDWIKGARAELPIECQIADWADSSAYSVDDIEDALRAGILDVLRMQELANEISNEVKAKLAEDGVADDDSITSKKAVRDEALKLQSIATKTNFRERKRDLKSWTSTTIGRLIKSCRIELRNERETCNRYRYRYFVPDSAKCLAYVLKRSGRKLVFDDPRVVTLESKGAMILQQLFKAFERDTKLMPLDFQEYIESKLESKERLIADFVSGMTDRYAYAYYGRLFQPGTGSFYEYV